MKRLNKENSSFLKNIKCLALDVDGVMTDGSLIYSHSGEALKVFNVKDGLGIKILLKSVEIILLSGNPSEITQKRCEDLGVKNVYLGIVDKKAILNKFLDDNKILKNEVVYIGDDLNDLIVRDIVGVFLSPLDADYKVKINSDYIIPVRGGRGVIRFVANLYQEHISNSLFKTGDW